MTSHRSEGAGCQVGQRRVAGFGRHITQLNTTGGDKIADEQFHLAEDVADLDVRAALACNLRDGEPKFFCGLPGNEEYLGLLWGSVDSYNTLSFYEGATLVGSITGSMMRNVIG